MSTDCTSRSFQCRFTNRFNVPGLERTSESRKRFSCSPWAPFRSLFHSHESSQQNSDSSLSTRCWCYLSGLLCCNSRPKRKFMKIYFARLLIDGRYEKFTQPVAERRSLTISTTKTDINNKFYDIISLSESCTFFVIFPSSRCCRKCFRRRSRNKRCSSQHRIYVRRKTEKGKSLRSGTEKKWSTFGVS